MSDLAKSLEIKAGVIEMGEQIAWGSDTALMREAAEAIRNYRTRVAELEAVLRQVRAEYSGTPYAQWNSTMHRVDAALEGK